MIIISPENYFLIAIGFIWIFGAVLQDLKRREVDNLWNFSLIAIALAYRVAISIYTQDYWFILNGLIGLGIFLFLGNAFYYSRLFAGGDAKLVIALGTILPLSFIWLSNFIIFALFIILFLIMGSIYSLIWAIVLVVENFGDFRKEFARQFKEYNFLFYIILIIAFFGSIFIYLMAEINLAILFFIVVILFPVLFVFAKSVEESCLKREVDIEKLSEGEWLYHDIIVDGTKIKASWEGLSVEELRLIKSKYKRKVLIKEGIPFTPSFLLSYSCLLILFIQHKLWF